MEAGGSTRLAPLFTPTEIGCHYDALDSFYRDVWGAHVHHGLWLNRKETLHQAQENLVKIVADNAQLTPEIKVCDIGCGYGETARWLAANTKCRITGVTNSPAQYQFALEATEPRSNPSFVLADWGENGLPDASFDSAIAIESAEHFEDLGRFFEQAQRVLKPGARLVVSGWTAAENATFTQRRLLLDPISRGTHMATFRTASEYLALANAAGFLRERFEDVSRRVARTWPSIALSFTGKLARSPYFFRFLVGQHAPNRRFAVAMLRIWMAYRLSALRYSVSTYVAK